MKNEKEFLIAIEREFARVTEDLNDQKKVVAENMTRNVAHTSKWNLEDLIKVEHTHQLYFRLVTGLHNEKRTQLVEEYVTENVTYLRDQIFTGALLSKSTCQMTNIVGLYTQEAQRFYIERVESTLKYWNSEH